MGAHGGLRYDPTLVGARGPAGNGIWAAGFFWPSREQAEKAGRNTGRLVMTFLLRFRFALVALLALIGASIATPSQAQGTIQLSILKGGWVIGASAGSGTLNLGGRSYPISIGGLSAGLVFGGSATDFRGTVSNIRAPQDIEGLYSAIGAGAVAAGGARVITLRNARGVTLRLQGVQAGLMVNLDLSGMTIRLR
jgi:hypothetical protein